MSRLSRLRAGFDERKGCGGKAEREWIPGHKCENDREPGKGRSIGRVLAKVGH